MQDLGPYMPILNGIFMVFHSIMDEDASRMKTTQTDNKI
jgi:hypothetical protein